MAYFGRSPKKPGSVPGAASGNPEKERLGTLRSIGRQISRGRRERAGRPLRAGRTERKQR